MNDQKGKYYAEIDGGHGGETSFEAASNGAAWIEAVEWA